MWSVALAVFATSLALPAPANSLNILGLFPHPGKSHFMAFEPLLKELVNRNHSVTVLSFFPQKEPLPNYHDRSLEGVIEIFQEVINMNDYEPYYGLENYYRFRDINFILSLPVFICEKLVQWPAVKELYMTDEKFDLVIIETFNSACLQGLAHRFGVPVIGVASHQVLAWIANFMGVPANPAFVPGVILESAHQMSFWERFHNTYWTTLTDLWFRYLVMRPETAIVRNAFGNDSPDLESLANNISLMLVNSHQSVMGPRAFPPGIVEVGGMHLNLGPVDINLSPELSNIVSDSKDGIVVFSLGSMIRTSTMPQYKLELILKTLSRFPQTFLWKYEDPSLIKEKPKNVHLMKWLPQQALLHHPKVVGFIAHGGLLGMTEAVDAGVPMLVIPFFGDQPGNAAQAAEAGLATVLPYTKITEQTLYDSLQKLLSPEMRQSAKTVSRIWHDRQAPPLETAVYWVERVARHGHDARLAPHSRHMPFYQKTLLDVIAVAVIFTAIVLFILYSVVKLLFNLLRRLVSSQKKVKIN